MEEYGLGDHQIWITEFGWATQNTTPGFEFGNQISFDQQADYIVGAMRRTREQYPWVGAMFLWNLNFAILRPATASPGTSRPRLASSTPTAARARRSWRSRSIWRSYNAGLSCR